MRRRFQVASLTFYVLTACMVLITVVSCVCAISWINKPFAGILMYNPPLVGSLGSRDWPGYEAGLRYLDRIVSADDHAISKGGDLVELAREKGPGTNINYRVDTAGQIREIAVPVTKFSLKDFLVAFFIPLLFGLALYILGVIVYALKPNTPTSWVFFLLCFLLGTVSVTGFEIQSSYYMIRFHYIVISLFPATFFHLGLIFPDRKYILTRYPKLEYLMYIPAFMLAMAWQVYFTFFPVLLSSDSPYSSILSYSFLGSFMRIFTLFCVASLVSFILHSTFKASGILARQRARMILFGVSIAFLPSAILMLITVIFKVNIPWNFLPFFLIFFPASIAYSVVKHNLFDADVIIKRTVGYVVVTAVIVGAYALVSVSFNIFLGTYQLAQSKMFPILFTLGVILVFNPLRDRIQAIVDRLFFRKEYDYGSIVEKVGGAMTSMLDLPQILKQLVKTFMDDMFIDTSSVILLTPDGSQYKIHFADGEKKQDIEGKAFKRNDPLFEIIEKEKKELTKYDVLEDPKYQDVSANSVSDFEAIQASLMVPLIYQDQVIGSMNLGEKKSGKPFNREDIDLLRTLGNQAAVAIENARLFQENLEKQRMEEELNIARDLQMSMLPAECPTVEGFDIAAYSVSAMEVGGDFYDFTDMGEDKAGFIIGDVTGKSVSGALVMSASRSVFRMLSEEELSVSESMIRANRRLKKDVKTGMFVALIFAVLNSEDKTLTLCSAGQTQPVHISAGSGEVMLVETAGDTFPLGILEEVDYKETRIQMAPGDKIILYTDGIVEAMNEKEELFGFERLLEVVEGTQSLSAEELLKEILNKVNGFAGEAEQHDDLTMIVISVK